MSEYFLKSNTNSSTFVKRQLEIHKESFNFRIQNEIKVHVGYIEAVSSNNKGYNGSRIDNHRDGLKFLVTFPKLGIRRFIIPKFLPEYYYSNYGLNEEAFLGLPISVETTSNIMPMHPVGDITSGDRIDLRRRQGAWAYSQNESNINSHLVTKKDIIVESTEPDAGAFGGVLNCAHKFLLNHIAKRGNHV